MEYLLLSPSNKKLTAISSIKNSVFFHLHGMKRTTHWLLSGIMFLQFFLWGLWMVTVGTYMLNTLHFDGVQVGLIYGSPAIAALVSPFLMGILADRYFSTDKLLLVLQFLGGGLLIWMAYIQTFSNFYILMLVYSFIFTPTLSLANAMVFHHSVDREKDFSNIRVWGTVGFILASALVSFLEWETTSNTLFFAGIGSILMGFYCFFLPDTPPIKQQQNSSLKSLFNSELKSLFFNRTFFVFVLCITLIRVPASFYYSFVNAYLVDIGMPHPTLKMASGQVLEILLMLTLPFMLKRFGIKALMLIAFAAWGLRYFCFAFGDMESGVSLLYMGMLLHGVCFTYSDLSAQIFIDQSVPPYLRNSAQGFILFLTLGLGVLLGSYIAGSVVDMHTAADTSKNWEAIWFVPATIGLAVAALFGLFFWPEKLEKKIE